MIELTEQQRQELIAGKPVRIQDVPIGTPLVVLRADVYDRLQKLLDDELLDMRSVAQLIEQNMAEDDAHDPLLDGYQ